MVPMMVHVLFVVCRCVSDPSIDLPSFLLGIDPDRYLGTAAYGGGNEGNWKQLSSDSEQRFIILGGKVDKRPPFFSFHTCSVVVVGTVIVVVVSVVVFVGLVVVVDSVTVVAAGAAAADALIIGG